MANFSTFRSCPIFIRYCLVFCLLVILLSLRAQAVDESGKQSGRPFIRNYSMKEYRAQQQNWTIGKDRQGLMYFGNGGGLLVFDGQNWEIAKLAVMRSIDMDSTGRIYIGVENNAGYLESDPSGKYRFKSIKPLIPEKYRDITPVFSTNVTKNGVVFMSNECLFILRDGKIEVIPSDNGFFRTFRVRDQIFVREYGKGLYLLEGGKLQFVEGSEIFSEERVYGMLPYGENEVLIVTMRNGCMIWSPGNKVRFRKPDRFGELDQFLSHSWPYCAIKLPDGNYAVGTVTAGIVIFSPEGKIVRIIDKKSGLQDNTVYNMYCDEDRNLWAALDNGISRIDYSLPFDYYTEQEGLMGSVLFVKHFANKLYIGTGQYLHIQRPDGSFKIVPGTDGQNFEMVSARNTLLLAHNPGIYEIRGNRASLVPGSSYITGTAFGTLQNKPDYLIVGGQGLDLMEYGTKGWAVKNHIKGFNFPAYLIIEELSGNFLVSSNSSLYRVKLNARLDSVERWSEVKAEKGLPEENAFPYKLISGEVVFSTGKGIYRYLPDKDRFEKHPDFMMITGKAVPFLQEPNGDIWYEESVESFDYHKGVLQWGNGKYLEFKTPFYKFNDANCNESAPNICVKPDHTVIFGTNMGLLRYDPKRGTEFSRPFRTMIRKVYARDSLLFGGYGPPTAAGQSGGMELPYNSHDLAFHFSATFYEDPEKNLFSYRLSGMDTTWSNWTNDHKKEYTNLHEGNYTFEVKSRNQYLEQGEAAAFAFTILAPWYRSWWAYLSYVILGGLAIQSLLYWRTRNLKLSSLALEKTVRERTNEIREQKINVEKLSNIGRDITSSLSIENITKTVYENVNTLMDASVFTIGLYEPEQNCLEFPAAIEKGIQLETFTIQMSEENRLAVWCFKNRKEVIINDYLLDYGKYVSMISLPIAGETPESILYLPLWNKEKVIGVISAQSFRKNAYSDYHINILRNLATYSAIALENADAYRRLSQLLDDLKTAQDRLVIQSKLAALGELTAGIAHEIQNPLNFVNNFAEVSNELIDEMKSELEKKNYGEADSLVTDIKKNLEKITFHGKRADSIVKGMLQHSGSTSGLKQPTDLNNLCDEFLRLAFHGLRAKDKSFQANIKTDFDPAIGKVEIVSEDIGRVVLNLISNAFYAVTEKKRLGQDGYEPIVWVSTKQRKDGVEISVKDNGTGIPKTVLDKIFQPFFTTKPAGQGTGLGLSLSYEIVTKGHGGELKVESIEGVETKFTVFLPVER